VLLNELKAREDDKTLRESIRIVGKDLNLSRHARRTYGHILSLFGNNGWHLPKIISPESVVVRAELAEAHNRPFGKLSMNDGYIYFGCCLESVGDMTFLWYPPAAVYFAFPWHAGESMSS
jgi:hypothetical protein